MTDTFDEVEVTYIVIGKNRKGRVTVYQEFCTLEEAEYLFERLEMHLVELFKEVPRGSIRMRSRNRCEE